MGKRITATSEGNIAIMLTYMQPNNLRTWGESGVVRERVELGGRGCSEEGEGGVRRERVEL